jgi:hypothetical protein
MDRRSDGCDTVMCGEWRSFASLDVHSSLRHQQQQQQLLALLLLLVRFVGQSCSKGRDSLHHCAMIVDIVMENAVRFVRI